MARTEERQSHEISRLLHEIARDDDPRRGIAIVRNRIRALEAEGAEVPEELTRVERQLLADCVAQSQGR